VAAEPAARILVVEDDASTAAGIVRGLRALEFEVDLSTNGTDGVRQILTDRYDVVVLDLMLPGQSGFDVLERVRHRSRSQVIVLTARTDLPDRLRAFDLGAADFVSKPFWIEELVARIRSRLRLEDSRPNQVIAWSGVRVDLDARAVDVEGKPASLTPTEFAVLAFLVQRPGRPVSRRVLAESVLASLDEPDARTVDSHVARLRKKLAGGAAAIVTVWGIGYRFDPGEGATRGDAGS
jgi:two-component system, OmpR family, response regulator